MKKLKKVALKSTGFEMELWEAFRGAFPSLRCVPFSALLKAARGDTSLLESSLEVSAEEAGFPDCPGSFVVYGETVRVFPYVGDRGFTLQNSGDIVATANYTKRPSAIAAEEVIKLLACNALRDHTGVKTHWCNFVLCN